MKIGIIDADLLARKKHRFPNLACMKISAYHKEQGHEVSLLLSYDDIENYDKVFVSKVFTDTPVPNGIAELSQVECGGTGFFYDKAPPLPAEIEHHMPDYHLYDEFMESQIEMATFFTEDEQEIEAIVRKKKNEFKYYLDYSIGFTTRGCIRGCSFCVNKNYRSCVLHSPVEEFFDPDRKYICLLDDNVLSCKGWKNVFDQLNATGKRFQFKQGMDERLLTDEKCNVIFNSNWIGDYIFAFDNIKDRRLVERKLQLMRKYTDKMPKFYVFCAYNHNAPDTYPEIFWSQDIRDVFERVKVLMSYHALPYIMRYKDYGQSPCRGMYITFARWCNQPSLLKKKSFREFCSMRADSKRYMEEFERQYPEIATEYFDMKWSDFDGTGNHTSKPNYRSPL